MGSLVLCAFASWVFVCLTKEVNIWDRVDWAGQLGAKPECANMTHNYFRLYSKKISTQIWFYLDWGLQLRLFVRFLDAVMRHVAPGLEPSLRLLQVAESRSSEKVNLHLSGSLSGLQCIAYTQHWSRLGCIFELGDHQTITQCTALWVVRDKKGVGGAEAEKGAPDKSL